MVSVEEFPVWERAVEEERLEIRLGGEWVSFPGSLFSNTPGTAGEPVEASPTSVPIDRNCSAVADYLFGGWDETE